MKKLIRNILKMSLVVMMIITISGRNNAIHADDEGVELAKGVVYELGDKIKISPEKVWMVVDDQAPLTIKIKGGTYTLTELEYIRNYIPENSGYWRTDNIFERADGGMWYLQFHYHDTTSTDVKPDTQYRAVGIMCYDGNGSDDSPFRFQILLEPYVNVTVNVGEGHEALAEAFYNSLPADDRVSLDGATVNARIAQKNGQNAKILLNVLEETKNKLIDLAGSTIDANEYLYALAPKSASEYSSYPEVLTDIMSCENVELVAGDSYTFNAIWAKPVSEVEMTIDNPAAGTKITCSSPYGIDQDPLPSVSFGSDSYRFMKNLFSPDKESINYRKRGTGTDYYDDVVMEAGKTYTVNGIVEPVYGYVFMEPLRLLINGNDESGCINSMGTSVLDFSYDIEALEDEFYPYQGDNGEWKKKSSDDLEFVFKRTVDDKSTFGSFIGIQVDGKDVKRDDKNYTANAGSVVISLKPAYLETLSEGEHTLTALFVDDMKAKARFTITKEESKESSDSADGSKSSGSKSAYRLPLTGIE